MTPKPGPEKKYPVEVYARIKTEHYEYLRTVDKDSISNAIRIVIERDMNRPPEE